MKPFSEISSRNQTFSPVFGYFALFRVDFGWGHYDLNLKVSSKKVSNVKFSDFGSDIGT